MKAGRVLDALIAEKVMEISLLKSAFHENLWCDRETGQIVKSYSTDISAAMEVFYKLRNSQDWCCLVISSDYSYHWSVTLTKSNLDIKTMEQDEHKPKVVVDRESLPLAICLAALKAIEVV